MYFKKLELFGFKSFADRTKLVFEPGVTAVVGPNGAGKSNLSDAIKWVLGEQSAKELRGGRMEDVIFNGTDTTQPVNIAEVSLTLSNEDRYLPVEYDEVNITRRVFRSGESEYLLNKTQVRLKDIQDILLGTGIGTSSYSITEQGKIDRVLDAKPEERREIFEEASGITKYKTRKKEALKKLEHTENNLIRLADIINEVKRQIGSIERQAKKAEKYKQEFERLKELDVKLSLHKYKNILSQKQLKDKQHQQLKENENIFTDALNANLQNLRNRRQELAHLERSISETKNHLLYIETSVDKNTSKVSLNKERIKELSSRRGLLTAEIGHIEDSAESLKGKIAQIEQAFDELGNKKDQMQNIVQEKQKALDALLSSSKECDAVISQSKLGIMANMAKQSKQRNELAKASANIASLGHRHRRLSAEKEAASGEMSAYTDKFKEAELALREQVKTEQASREQAKKVQEDLRSVNKEYSLLTESIVSFEKSLAGCASKLEVLVSQSQANEGLSEGARSYLRMLNESKESKDAYVGILADIIKIKSGYERAVEAALGDGLESIVLKEDSAAIRAIDYLAKHKKGKASFIILDRSIKKDASNNLSAESLGNFIDAEESHKELLSCLFNEIFVAETLEDALSFVKESKNKNIKVVTKNGSSVSYNRIVGGGIGQAEYTGIAGRKHKIEQLSKEAEDLKRRIEKAKVERAELMAKKDSVEKELQSKEGALREQEKKTASVEADKARLETELKKLKEDFNLVEMELEEILQQEEELKTKENNFKEELEGVETAHQGLEDVITEKQKLIDSNILEKDNLLIGLTETKTELSLFLDKYTSEENTLNMLKDSLGKEGLNLDSRRQQIKEGEERTGSLNDETQRITQENEILQQQKTQLNIKLTELENVRYAMAVDVEKAEEDALRQQKEADQLKSNVSTLHINITELNYEANSVKERIYQAYKVDLDQTDITFNENEDWQKIAAEADELKQRIDEMGPVNLVAIDEHKELEERYNFLTSQQQDLLEAKESLHKAINKINRTTRQLFTETFEKIRVYFKDYFRLLFGGGTADVFLIDQADILESGIEIVARPPGKKLQNISLLSGGEKALTSIALLFALYKVKPSPFCVLDEIDAPLDEANIDRFSRILQEFLSVSQFIIITHNKRTIGIADVMYGITMEKTGISKIVSVKFAQEEIEKQEKAQTESKQIQREKQAQPLPVEDKEPTVVEE